MYTSIEYLCMNRYFTIAGAVGVASITIAPIALMIWDLQDLPIPLITWTQTVMRLIAICNLN